MARLLADAEKLSGVHYDIDNLGDVYSAIHVIQENLGLTGVAAEEASETFTGSLNAMKASAQNVLANLALGEDIRPALQTLGTSVRAFFVNNLMPMIGNIFASLPDVLGNLNGIVLGLINSMVEELPAGIDMFVTTFGSLLTEILSAAPYIAEAAFNIASGLVNALISFDWVTFGTSLVQTIKDNLDFNGLLHTAKRALLAAERNGKSTSLFLTCFIPLFAIDATRSGKVTSLRFRRLDYIRGRRDTFFRNIKRSHINRLDSSPGRSRNFPRRLKPDIGGISLAQCGNN
jgi:hypothetical protein